MDLSGSWRAAPADDELRRVGIGFDFDDSSWATLAVPGHWRDHADFADSHGPLLYRRRFDVPTPNDGERLFVTLDGVFYQADVWLDGAYLGDPEGYFAPHTFDITSLARLSHEHVLAVEVTCSPQRDPRGKRNITGAFQLGGTDHQNNPGGLWRGVHLHVTGPVRIDRCRVLCRDANETRAHLRLSARLDSDVARTAVVRTLVDGVPVDQHEQSLARGVNEVEWNFDINDPRLWWPWSLGEQPLTSVTIEVFVDGLVSHAHTARTGLREIAVHDWVFSVNGERLFVKGVNLDPAHPSPATASPVELRRDIELARDAGLDLVRIHRHVARAEVYDAADELGMLVWQDFPLVGGYARSVRRQAVDQARAVVDLLGHHPSIAIWCGHDAPESTAIGQQVPTWNKSILDRWVKRAFERSDETRPVVAHSGMPPHLPQLDGTDSHLSFGWHRGDERDLAGFAAAFPRMVRFVSEFGTQSVADATPFIDAEQWPALDWERLASDDGLDRAPMERHVPAQEFRTFAEWRLATQRYQATVVRHHIEALRRLKYQPTGGFCVSSLADAAPCISTSLLDHERRPKLAYQALIDACRPVIVVSDRLPAQVDVGSALALDVHVVSDLRATLDDVTCTATLRWPGGQHVWSWRGSIGADSCARVDTIQFLVPDAPGELWLDLTIDHGDEVATNRDVATIVRT